MSTISTNRTISLYLQGGQMKKLKIRKKNSKIRKSSENFPMKIRKKSESGLECGN